MENFSQLYQKLNPAQKEAVDTIEGPLMVIAGAGTGKTQVLAMRIANILLQTQLNPNNILCLTFTDSAVAAMRKRLVKFIGPTAYGVQVYTFHSFCNDIINAHPDKFPELGRKALALKDIDKLRLLTDILENFNESLLKPFGKSDTYLKEIASRISNLKSENITPNLFSQAITQNQKFKDETQTTFTTILEIPARKLTQASFEEFINALKSQTQFSDHPFIAYLDKLIEASINAQGDVDDRTAGRARTALRKRIKELYHKYFSDENLDKQVDLQKVYANYQARLREEKRYDFEDMIMLVVDKLSHDSELLSELQEQYQYILVDEYQDTNSAQNQALTLLGNFFETPNICVVGDDDQAIYRFQGASVENMLYFRTQYEKGLKLVTLVDNYRSHQLILDASASLIENNGFRISSQIPQISKKLQSKAQLESRPLEVHDFFSAAEQYQFLAQQIKTLFGENVAPQEIAVLVKENREIGEVAQVLAQQDIPFTIEKGEDVFKQENILQLLKLLEYLADVNNQQQLFSLLTFPWLGISQLDLLKANQHAYRNKLTLWEVLADENKLKVAGIAALPKITELVTKLAKWQQNFIAQNPVIFFNDLIHESGYLDYIMAQPQKYELLSNLQRLYEELKSLVQQNENYTLKEFMRDLRLYQDFDLELKDKQIALGEKRVRIMTAHGAKGLEFEYVFIPNCLDRRWGNGANRNKIKLPLGLVKTESIASDNDEERRLFYVALTRAKRNVYICYPRFNVEGRDLAPSQFLTEVNADFLKIISHDKSQTVLEAIWQQSTQSSIEYSQQGKLYLKALVEDLTMSVSHVNAYLKCPHCFFLESVLCLPKLPSKHAAFGTAMHEVMRYWQTYLKENKADPEVNDLIMRAQASLKSEFLSDPEMQEVLGLAEKTVQAYYDENKGKLSENVEAEFNFRRYNLHLDGEIAITGKIDAIIHSADKHNEVTVVDYKTSNPDNKSADLSVNRIGDYYRQLLFYKILIDSTPSLGWQVQSGKITFMLPSKKKHEFVDVIFDLPAADIATVKAQTREIYAKIQNLEFAGIGKACKNDELHKIKLTI